MSETATAWPPHPPGFPEYHPRELPLGGHLHTLLIKIGPGEKELKQWMCRDLQMPVSDRTDDKLLARLYAPDCDEDSAAAQAPMVVLLHGLGGEAGSSYMRAAALSLLQDGYRVLLVNSRGCGKSADLCRRIHHPGRTQDVCDLFDGLVDLDEERVLRCGIVLVGLSLGGNLVAKFLAEHGHRYPILGGVCVSAALNLQETADRLDSEPGYPYQWYLLRRMRREVLRDTAHLTDQEWEAVLNARSVREFDNTFTAPRFGFRDAEEFYRANSAEPGLSDIPVPTAIIHAEDDPIVPPDAYRRIDWSENRHLLPLIVPQGGHVGFLTVGDQPQWHHQCISHVVEESRKRGAFATLSNSDAKPQTRKAAQRNTGTVRCRVMVGPLQNDAGRCPDPGRADCDPDRNRTSQ